MTSCRAHPPPHTHTHSLPTENKHLLSEKPEPLLKGRLQTRLPLIQPLSATPTQPAECIQFVCTLGFSLATTKKLSTRMSGSSFTRIPQTADGLVGKRGVFICLLESPSDLKHSLGRRIYPKWPPGLKCPGCRFPWVPRRPGLQHPPLQTG